MNRRTVTVLVLAAGAGLVWWSQRREPAASAAGSWNRIAPQPGAAGQDSILTIPIFY